jgi:hypothetical protein
MLQLFSPAFWRGFGSVLTIAPPRRTFRTSLKLRSAVEAHHQDWLKLGGDMQRAMGRTFERPKKPTSGSLQRVCR